MAKLKPIRDPVHNYIPTTPIEISIIDSPEFQRLRFILQNASAYLTYPGSTNNRFLHSLGVMHLSGLFFVNALRNTDLKTLADYLNDADLTLKKYENELTYSIREYIQQWQESIGNICQYSHDPFCGNRIELTYELEDNGPDEECIYYINYHLEKEDKRLELHHDPYYIINTLWQSLRLAALIHDIGHLPMSHIFEEAVNDHQLQNTIGPEITKRKQKYGEKISHDIKRKDEFDEILRAGTMPLHELRGLIIFEKYRPKSSAVAGIYQALVYKIAKDIFLLRPVVSKPEDPFRSLRCLHGIISGELDADRLDYCLRDPKSSGLEYGAIDAQRVLDNTILYKEDEIFFIAQTDKSLSAIEAFFHQRYVIYQYLIYHHNVVRSDGVLKEIIIRLIDQAYQSSTPDNENLQDLLNKFHFIKKVVVSKPTECCLLSDEYSHIFDDAWLRTIFSEVYILLSEKVKIKKARCPKWIEHLHLLIETFLYRKTNNLFSMWKRPTDFQITYQKIASSLKDETIESVMDKKLFIFQKRDDSKKESLIKHIKTAKQEIESNYDTVVIHRYLEPKIYRFEKHSENLKILLSDQETKSWKIAYIGEASPYVKSLIETVLNTPNYHISFVGKSIKDKPEIIENCVNIVIKNLVFYYRDIKEIESKKTKDLRT